MKSTRLIILNSIIAILFSISSMYAQSNSSIKGTVKDNSGEGLVGANVRILNTNYGASANMNGDYQINNLPAGSHTLEVSYIGFKTITKNVVLSQNKVTTVNLILQESENLLDEVLIKGQSLT